MALAGQWSRRLFGQQVFLRRPHAGHELVPQRCDSVCRIAVEGGGAGKAVAGLGPPPERRAGVWQLVVQPAQRFVVLRAQVATDEEQGGVTGACLQGDGGIGGQIGGASGGERGGQYV